MNQKLTMAPFAVATDGTVFANVAHVAGEIGLMALVRRAKRMDGAVFIGIAFSREQKKKLLLVLDNAGAEAIAKSTSFRQRPPARRPSNSSRRSR